MARKSSIPEEILQYKPCKCSKVRNDNGIYHVYKYSAVKLPSGKWGADSGYLIGKIIPGVGFSPNKRYTKELEQQSLSVFSDEITDVSYGQYAFLISISADIYDMLKQCFPLERATQIYAYGLILCVNGFVYLDQVYEFYLESYLSLLYRDFTFKMGYEALSALLHDLGSKGNPVAKFEQLLIDNADFVAIDGHVIRSCSLLNDLAELGYKAQMLKDAQVNVLIAFDIRNHRPIMYKTYRGSSIDKSSVINFLNSRSFKNTKFVVDSGFYSDDVLTLMSKDGNSYIIPVPKSNKNLKRIRETLSYTSGEFVYRADRKTTARIIYYEEKIDENTRIIFFKDEDENNSKRKSYKIHMDAEDGKYTQEKYNSLCDWWGVYVLQTSSDEPAYAVFADYKDRWSIETYNNYVKNDAGFANLKFQDYYAQHGFDFIMLVTGLIHAKLNDAVLALNKPSISTFDVLIRSGHMRMVKKDDLWHLHNTRTKDLELLQKMGFLPAQTYPEVVT